MLELNQCYNMDCMKGMAQFPDGFFDLAVVDPPYFSGPERRGYYGSKVSKIGVYRDYPVSPVWEIPGRAYFDELRRVAKHYIVWGCNYFSYEFAPGRIVWDKCKKGTSFSDCELAATDLFNTVRLFRFTFDNGTEFAAAEELERSCVNKRLPRTKVYFCHPYSSWERGTNENTNGMIRRRFPKGTNFAAVTNAQIAQAENWINNYPRKILGYKSSEIVFRECLRELGIAA